MSLSKEGIEAVLRALENDKYTWRTIRGVSKEAALSYEQVTEALAAAAGQVIKAPVTSADGHELFTTRRHFRARAGVMERVLGVIKNRAV